MKNEYPISRRVAVKSSLFGLLSVSIPHVLFAKSILPVKENEVDANVIDSRYPAINEAMVNEVVSVSHFNLDRVKELVDKRPELARATWDWGFGDWETAIGAASHVGRRDIVDYLLLKGARPDIFTFAMMGAYGSVKSMIETAPGIQSIAGPHGISLLQHVKNGMDRKNPVPDNTQNLIDYLESLGNADSPVYADLDEKEKQKYLGDYKYGEGEGDGFSIKLNMRKSLSLGKLGKFGGGLYRVADNVFKYNGTSSVEIHFLVENGQVKSLTVSEPGLTLLAKKI